MVLAHVIGVTSMLGNGAPSGLLWYCIPLYNSVQAMNGIFSFSASSLQVAVTVCSNLLYAGVGAWVLTRMVQQREGHVLALKEALKQDGKETGGRPGRQSRTPAVATTRKTEEGKRIWRWRRNGWCCARGRTATPRPSFALAKDPAVGPVAGWPPHQSVQESLQVIRTVLSGPECYAICERGRDVPIGAVELILNGRTDMTARDDECELGYWLASHSGAGVT